MKSMYLHDVWVSWVDGASEGYDVLEFHEWRRSDTVELLDQAPLLKVSPEFYEYIENDIDVLPAELLKEVENKAYLRKNHQRMQLKYCFIVTAGGNILAVDTLGNDSPIRKSRIIPRQEQIVWEMVKDQPASEFPFIKPVKQYNTFHLDPSYVRGLTRRERTLKQILFMALDDVHSSGNPDKLKYFYSEWNSANYNNIKHLNLDELMEIFTQELSIGWTSKHEEFCPIIVKCEQFYETMYENEIGMKIY